MIKSYGKLFTIPGTAWFSAAAFLGRLPAGMIGLAIIMPISKFTGSYMIAGMVAACTMTGMALFAPLSGRLVDRYGQRSVLFIFAVLNCIGTSMLIVCARYGAPLAVLCAAGILTGASRLSTGMIARIRWIYVTQILDTMQRQSALQTAYAFESIVDEVVFISAPILVTLLCTVVNPLAGLVSCLLSYVIGSVALYYSGPQNPDQNS